MTIQTLTEKVISPYQTYENPIFIDWRTHGLICRISDDKVAKIPFTNAAKKSCSSPFYIGREMKIARMLFERGVSVPRPFVWDYIRYPKYSAEPQKAFIMEYIEGETGGTLGQQTDYEGIKRYRSAKEALLAELKKAKDLGFRAASDSKYGGNYIFTSENKIVLIDFAGWAHPNVPKTAWKLEDSGWILKGYVDPEKVFREEGK